MAQAVPLPLDIRLMNGAASALFALLGAGLLVAAGLWAVRNPGFALKGITVIGDVAHNSAATLRTNVAPQLRGNFFTVDLAQARTAFEAVPWVRRAVVRREFPDRLRVTLEEHQPVAYWGVDGEGRLVNSFGEVFDANTGDIEQDDLPRLHAADAALAPQVLAMYQALRPLFEALDLGLEQLVLNGRGSWQAGLDNGATMELGRGGIEELLPRVRRFTSTLTQVAGQHGRRAEALASADLRHIDGYAVRLRGVTTVPDATAQQNR